MMSPDRRGNALLEDEGDGRYTSSPSFQTTISNHQLIRVHHVRLSLQEYTKLRDSEYAPKFAVRCN